MAKLTELQQSLREEHLNRSFDEVLRITKPAFDPHRLYMAYMIDGMEAEIIRKVSDVRQRLNMVVPAITIVDVGCGSGRAIEECARTLSARVERLLFADIQVNAIGIDANPLPELIDTDFLERTGGAELRADIHVDDAATLSSIPDVSADIVYSIHCLDYVEDALRALEASWRVLKPGGIMVHHVTYSAISDPDFDEIVKDTFGAQDVFSLATYYSDFSDHSYPNLVVGRKTDGSTFDGFPYECVGDSFDLGATMVEAQYGFIRIGRYLRFDKK